ncbi:hypothetical protein J6590_060124 [Homalodisca vitripennis]|nr:hypothetical protein J6590_060124 [Homalodisca vitripennis]
MLSLVVFITEFMRWVRPAPSPPPSSSSISDEEWSQAGRQLRLDALREWRSYFGGSRRRRSNPVLEYEFTPSETFQPLPDPYCIQAWIPWDEVPTLQALSALQVCRSFENKEELLRYFEESGPCGLIPILKGVWDETGHKIPPWSSLHGGQDRYSSICVPLHDHREYASQKNGMEMQKLD